MTSRAPPPKRRRATRVYLNDDDMFGEAAASVAPSPQMTSQPPPLLIPKQPDLSPRNSGSPNHSSRNPSFSPISSSSSARLSNQVSNQAPAKREMAGPTPEDTNQVGRYSPRVTQTNKLESSIFVPRPGNMATSACMPRWRTEKGPGTHPVKPRSKVLLDDTISAGDLESTENPGTTKQRESLAEDLVEAEYTSGERMAQKLIDEYFPGHWTRMDVMKPPATLGQRCLRVLTSNISRLGFVGDLPDEMFALVLFHVHWTDLRRLEALNKNRHSLFDAAWAKRCLSDFGFQTLPGAMKNWKELYDTKTKEVEMKNKSAVALLRGAYGKLDEKRKSRMVKCERTNNVHQRLALKLKKFGK